MEDTHRDKKEFSWEKVGEGVALSPLALLPWRAFLTPVPPAHGFYVDCGDGKIRSAERPGLCLPGGDALPSGVRGFRFFSTGISRGAGDGWKAEDSIRKIRLLVGIRRKNRDTGVSEGEEIDLDRFRIQMKVAALFDFGKTPEKEVHSYIGRGSTGKPIGKLLVVKEVGAGNVRHWEGGRFDYDVGTEGRDGDGGRSGRKIKGSVERRVGFVTDVAGGYVIGPDGEASTANLPKNPNGGVVQVLDWTAPFFLSRRASDISRNFECRKSVPIVLPGAASTEAGLKGLAEAMAYLVHQRGPRGGGVMRARGKLVAGESVAMFETGGSSVGAGKEGWIEARKLELAKLGEICKRAGVNEKVEGIGKLKREFGRKGRDFPGGSKNKNRGGL